MAANKAWRSPRPRIQRVLLHWLQESRPRWQTAPRVSKRTAKAVELAFPAFDPRVRAVLTREGIDVCVIVDGECWDILWSLDVTPVRTRHGYVCGQCDVPLQQCYPDRESLWRDHLFESLLDWANRHLVPGAGLTLSGQWGGWTTASVKPPGGRGGVSTSVVAAPSDAGGKRR